MLNAQNATLKIKEAKKICMRIQVMLIQREIYLVGLSIIIIVIMETLFVFLNVQL